MKGRVVGSALLLVIPALATAASLELGAARDRTFCAQVLELFRQNMGGGNRLDIEAEPFSHVTWEPATITGTAPKTRYCSSLDKAMVDLDNDGTKDLVVRATFCMKGRPSDSLYMFPADSRVLEQVSWQDMAPLLGTRNRFEHTGGRYPLTAIPMSSLPGQGQPTLKTVFTVLPFVADERTYIALMDGRGEWMAITRFVGGERFDDQCYFRSGGKS